MSEIVKNVFKCTLCGGIVDKHEFVFKCKHCKALGDLTTGTMTNVDLKAKKTGKKLSG